MGLLAHVQETLVLHGLVLAAVRLVVVLFFVIADLASHDLGLGKLVGQLGIDLAPDAELLIARHCLLTACLGTTFLRLDEFAESLVEIVKGVHGFLSKLEHLRLRCPNALSASDCW